VCVFYVESKLRIDSGRARRFLLNACKEKIAALIRGSLRCIETRVDTRLEHPILSQASRYAKSGLMDKDVN